MVLAPIKTRAFAGAVVAAAGCMLIAAPALASTSPPVGSWTWPIEGRVVRGFVPPATPFSAGHRGIDIAAAFGTPVRAPADGVVTFAGFVAGELFVTVDHGDGYRSTDSWLGQALVKKGQTVKRGDVVALSGRGDPKVSEENLMFSVRIGGTYVDPLTVLAPQSVVELIRLAPLTGSSNAAASEAAAVTRAWPWPARSPSDEGWKVRAEVRGPPRPT